eukprot:436823_1
MAVYKIWKYSVVLFIITIAIVNLQYITGSNNLRNIVSQSTSDCKKRNEIGNVDSKPRVVVSISVTRHEVIELYKGVNHTINWIFNKHQTYQVDAFYLQIPYMQIQEKNRLYPRTNTLKSMFPQPKVIINRLFVDYGPMSRYIGVMDQETDSETIIITFDVDIAPRKKVYNFISKLVEHIEYDPNSCWTMSGETPIFSISRQKVIHVEWERTVNPIQYDDEHSVAWDKRTVFRAVRGVAFKRRFLDHLWYNATEYYEGCFWDDDHWMSFNLEIKGIAIKTIQEYVSDRYNSTKQRRLGSLSEGINKHLEHTDMKCLICI